MYKNIAIWKCGWQSPNRVPEHTWMNPENWDFWLWTTHPKAPDGYLKFQKSSEGHLVDNHPMKRVKIEKGSLFDLLPVEILSIINDWAISFEYNDKRIVVMNQIFQKNPILYKPPYTKLKPFHNFIPLSFYDASIYGWAHRHYNNHRTWFGPKAQLTNNNPSWVY